MTKYPLTTKTENPRFEFLVKDLMDMDYYLFTDFNSALKRLRTLSLQRSHHALLYEKKFNTNTREFHGKPTFQAMDGYVVYDPYVFTELHLEFYVNAGEWLNPEELGENE